jgi:hypothetical protein
MQKKCGQTLIDRSRSPNVTLLTRWLTVALLAGVFSPALALAQSGKFGSYVGTLQVSGKGISPPTTFRATVKINLPIIARSSRTISVDFPNDDTPDARVQIAQWDSSSKGTSRESDGKISSWTCALAAPVEIAMQPTGILFVDLEKKKHELSLTLLSAQDVDFNCVHSRSGPYKKKEGIILYLGTGAPGAQGNAPLPFADAARLTAKFTLMPTPETQDTYGPLVQEWDLRLVR